MGLFSARNLDLPRKVHFSVKKKPNPHKIDKRCRLGRTYIDFLNYMSVYPDTSIVELDSVEGRKGGKVLLTIHFVKAEFMLAYIRDHNDAQSVIDIINQICSALNCDVFSSLFPLILTDNGSEFSNPEAIEISPEGITRTLVFYCDPSSPYQKGSAEVNHEMIRRFIPKGTSFDRLTQQDVSSMMDHINSYRRSNLGGKSPYEMMRFLYGPEILRILRCHFIPAHAVTLNDSIFAKGGPNV